MLPWNKNVTPAGRKPLVVNLHFMSRVAVVEVWPCDNTGAILSGLQPDVVKITGPDFDALILDLADRIEKTIGDLEKPPNVPKAKP